MGLDMYMHKKTYVKNWKHMKKEELHKITIKKGGKNTHIKPERISEIVEEVAYWRKANAIHNWFVENVQKGVDDCKDYYVDIEDLQKLINTIDTVLENSKLVKGKIEQGYTFKDGKKEPILADGEYIEDATVAKKLLPTTEGFFFGGTDYNQYYVSDLKYTKEVCEKLIKEYKEWSGASLYYSSSW